MILEIKYDKIVSDHLFGLSFYCVFPKVEGFSIKHAGVLY